MYFLMSDGTHIGVIFLFYNAHPPHRLIDQIRGSHLKKFVNFLGPLIKFSALTN